MVFLAQHVLTAQEVALKLIPVSELVPADQVDSVFQEAKNLQKLTHNNIIKLHKVVLIESTLYLMMEYFSGGDLRSYLSLRNTPLTDEQIRMVMQQMCSAVFYCHSLSVVHRDIKPQNILLSKDESLENIKLIDFGIAGEKTYDVESDKKTTAGTLKYLPPEVLTREDTTNNP